MTRHIGLYGGTFDPPHAGHLAVGQLAADRLRLDEVWYVVAARPDGKPDAAPFEARVQLTQTLVADSGDQRLRVSTHERQLDDRGDGVVHSADTVTALRHLYPGVSFTWLVGSDVAATIDQWPGADRLLNTVELAIIVRPGYPLLVPDSVTAWTAIAAPLPNLSSTNIRAAEAAAAV